MLSQLRADHEAQLEAAGQHHQVSPWLLRPSLLMSIISPSAADTLHNMLSLSLSAYDPQHKMFNSIEDPQHRSVKPTPAHMHKEFRIQLDHTKLRAALQQLMHTPACMILKLPASMLPCIATPSIGVCLRMSVRRVCRPCCKLTPSAWNNRVRPRSSTWPHRAPLSCSPKHRHRLQTFSTSCRHSRRKQQARVLGRLPRLGSCCRNQRPCWQLRSRRQRH